MSLYLDQSVINSRIEQRVIWALFLLRSTISVNELNSLSLSLSEAVDDRTPKDLLEIATIVWLYIRFLLNPDMRNTFNKYLTAYCKPENKLNKYLTKLKEIINVKDIA